MAVIGAKGNFAGPGGAFEEEKKREIVCNEVCTGNLRKNDFEVHDCRSMRCQQFC